MLRVLAFAGALRAGSYNRKLVRLAVETLRGKTEVDLLDLREVMMPLYDGDLEEKEGLPQGARAFKARIAAADALVISTPEYNNSVPGTLKNAIDWASRPPDNPFKEKVVLLMGASPGQFGAVRGTIAVRQILTSLNAVVIPSGVLIARADQAFDETGAIKDGRSRAQIDKACAELVRMATALKG
ncbi:MAG TPA: NAD(P)H-dependent oxidoreductase [Candidatus Polarisedimenticolia bacterium]|nr:NAD(P)H-dependent oxidoreductase [Candidatus Polarisedimenticolia bacterium]